MGPVDESPVSFRSGATWRTAEDIQAAERAQAVYLDEVHQDKLVEDCLVDMGVNIDLEPPATKDIATPTESPEPTKLSPKGNVIALEPPEPATFAPEYIVAPKDSKTITLSTKTANQTSINVRKLMIYVLFIVGCLFVGGNRAANFTGMYDRLGQYAPETVADMYELGQSVTETVRRSPAAHVFDWLGQSVTKTVTEEPTQRTDEAEPAVAPTKKCGKWRKQC
eukprot:FR741514.1.p1 GENE.FR741514.1~~FR741514.1.p1  ORF type:complete len:234 (+),score=16.55 FR741514.1:35-703(+)